MVFDREIKDDRIIYTRVLTSTNEQENLATLRVIYTFYTDVIRREYIITNDWLDGTKGSSLSAYFSTNFFIPYSSLILKTGYDRFEKTIYPSDDSVTLNEIFDTIYPNDGKTGIYLHYAPTAPRPSDLSYKGSTVYNATSSISVGQLEPLKSGAAVHITQYLAIGDEVSAQESIEGRMSIELLSYPDGIIPIVFTGSLSSTDSDSDAKQFYAMNRIQNLQYTEAADTTHMNIQDVVREGVEIIGQMSVRTSGNIGLDSFTEQDDGIKNLIRNGRMQGATIEGFMPLGLIYNLDTIRVLNERGLDFMIAIPVRAPYNKVLNMEGLRHPQMAQLEGESTDLVLLPISYPMSMPLAYSADEAEMFASWRDVIDSAYANNDLALFILRSTDLANPYFSARFANLIEYARMRGLTFTTPATIAEHYRLLELVTWTSQRDLDSARITIQNDNNIPVSGITFQVEMPRLETGNYRITNGEIVRTQELYDRQVLFITADIPAGGSTVVTVEMDVPRKQFSVVLPGEPIEGEVTFSVLDEDGNPLNGATVFIDSARFKTDDQGVVTVSLVRGYHRINVEKAGYAKAEYLIEVKSRIYFITRLIGLG
ncbi:MAG: Ig-like domain-containing protein, partial [Methanomicrobiaceae archaeon]|nr:Ig-like domain-containing protein [Methanomicrobiaceae archaeon]